ncbi:MAG: hypothetical protein JXB13_04645 [Phycisphaerae bacterium]|nr:hypothetical protein [Phycisphaerae bacterium]
MHAPGSFHRGEFLVLASLLAFLCLTIGCQTGAPGAASDPPDTLNTEIDPAPPADGPDIPAGLGALVVETVEGATNTQFDIYRAVGAEAIRTYQEAYELIPLAPGLYRLTQYFNAGLVHAADVPIEEGVITTVTLGAIELVTVPNASDGQYDIYDATGATEYSTYNEPNVRITAPEGTFTLKEYFNGDFVYATGVTVTAGEVTTIEMGGIELTTVTGAVDGTYGIYDEAGEEVFSTYNDPDIIVTAPAGTFTLKEYFNDRFTYASDVQVIAGEATTVPMGAIRFNGPLAYDIYVGGEIVSSYNDPQVAVTAPAGTYTLTKYFDEDVVLATDVVVTAGAVTEVP